MNSVGVLSSVSVRVFTHRYYGLPSTRFTTKIRIMLLALQDKSLFASFKFLSDLMMVGQSKLMPGQMPGYARVWLRLCGRL